MKNSKLKSPVLCGILASLSLISFLIENLLPPLFIPGARLGLSNLFILLTLIILGKKYSYTVVVIKTVLGSIFAGNPSMILYGLPAGLISLTIEILLISFCKVSVIAISVSGAVINTVIQNVIFCLITKYFGYFIYLPYLVLLSTFAGIIVGLAVYFSIKYIPTKIIKDFTKSREENF